MTMHGRGTPSVNDDSRISSTIGDDTIELQLTPEQLRELSQAAETAQPAAPASRFRRWHLTPFAKMAGATFGYIVLAWWSAAQLPWRPEPIVMAAARPIVNPRPVVLTAGLSESAVRVINPFDATEVFEFPAGTSPADGRAQVAQKLLQRARERQSQWEHIRPAASLRTASTYGFSGSLPARSFNASRSAASVRRWSVSRVQSDQKPL
jgi:hypothetical protein